MQFNVSQLIIGPIGIVKRHSIYSAINGMSMDDASVVEGSVAMMRTDAGVLVQGEFKANITCNCVRCLRDFAKTIDLSFEEEYVPVLNFKRFTTKEDLAIENLLIDANNLLDLEPTIQEYVELNKPVNPVCNGQCPGICSRCGVDLSQVTCLCNTPAAMSI